MSLWSAKKFAIASSCRSQLPRHALDVLGSCDDNYYGVSAQGYPLHLANV